MRIKVETRQDGNVDVPWRFSLNGDHVDVFEMVDQWFGDDYRYCKVKGSDGALYILRYDELRSEWCLTMFASERAQAVTAEWTSPRQSVKGLLQ
ncbi:hypothetical protein [Mesorhizobium sp.]|uniref:hypothetical protein n=1 Tax=Mesorhizobium sp. TaxID=1871066 RepID=UPI000FE891A5|nr:hypothetical protein [Mesorhizobium sp.]RWA66943.1 MAG: hypothetical protein EOQ29_25280 [Mesorhizobium sp.]RWA86766.1 MAG: hypothetical protein EOQ30_00440 [Mesorhizobium sp.]